MISFENKIALAEHLGQFTSKYFSRYEKVITPLVIWCFIYLMYSDWICGQAHVMHLVSSLQNLAIVEESTERDDNEIKSMQIVAAQHSERMSTLSTSVFFEFLTSPFPVCYPYVPPVVRAELLDNFRRLCFVESPLVNFY